MSFTSPDMQQAFRAVIAAHPESYKEQPAWAALLTIDIKDRAEIEGVGKMITWLISAVGLLLFLSGRKNQDGKLSLVASAGLILSVVFMRDVVIGLYNLYHGNMLCQEAKLWQHLHWPVFPASYAYTAFCVGVFLWILYLVPKAVRRDYIIGMGIGGVIGGGVWVMLI